MTHLKTTKARRNFIINKIKKASPKEIEKLYFLTEKYFSYK